MNNLQTLLANAIISWYDDSMESYHGLDDENFIRRVCERTGMSEEEYHNIMDGVSDIEEWLILSNNSACDDLSIYYCYGAKEDAYKKMQAMVLATAAKTDEERYIEVNMNSSELTATIQWSETRAEFRVVKKADVPSIDEADGVADANLDAIPDDISWDNEFSHKALFNIDEEDMKEDDDVEAEEILTRNMIFTSNGAKQIVFDDFVDNTEEYQSYYVQMCPHCHNKYKNILGNKACDGAMGTCSVKGCEKEADYYVDFAKNEVTFA